MNNDEVDLIIAEQNKSTEEILKVIDKIKAYFQEFCALKNKQILILEQENAELKEKLDAIDKAGEQVRHQINDTFRDKPSYADLERENAELKDKFKITEAVDESFALQTVQLIKAKEIIENMLKEFERMDVLCNYQLRTQAERFLKEIE